MFNNKVPKQQSSSKLLKLLTKRSSQKRLSIRRGIYDEWPNQQKPSLFNYSTNYLKYLNNCTPKEKDKQNSSNIKKKNPSFSKKPATFSTCTTMEFFPLTQQNIQAQSKFTVTPKSLQSNEDKIIDQKSKFTPYMTPLQDTSQIYEESEQHLQKINDQQYEEELNSKYYVRPKTFNQSRKTTGPQRRLVKTAKLHRQKLQIEEQKLQAMNLKKQSSSRQVSSTLSRPTTAKTTLSNQQNQGFIRPVNSIKSPVLSSNNSQQNIQVSCNYPLRLKDYETNFQAYKVVSQLIDQQMKWQPKRKRPKSSVSFRKYIGFGIKA